MRQTLLVGSVVTVIGFAFAGGPAYADCPEDIQRVEARLASLGGMDKQKKKRAVQAVESLLDKAKDAWSAGDAKKCENLTQKASEKAKEKLN